SLRLKCSFASSTEVGVEVIEERGSAGHALVVGRMCEADPGDDVLDSLRLRKAELGILEIDVVNDLCDRTERCVLNVEPIDEDLERATVPLVGVLRFEHVETQFACFRSVTFACDELETRVRIEKPPDEPAAGHPIDVNSFPRNPGAAADLCALSTGLGSVLFSSDRVDKPGLEAAKEAVH